MINAHEPRADESPIALWLGIGLAVTADIEGVPFDYDAVDFRQDAFRQPVLGRLRRPARHSVFLEALERIVKNVATFGCKPNIPVVGKMPCPASPHFERENFEPFKTAIPIRILPPEWHVAPTAGRESCGTLSALLAE